MVSGYTLTTFPNAILAATATTKCKGKSNNNKHKMKRVLYIQRGTGTAQIMLCEFFPIPCVKGILGKIWQI